MIQFYETKKFKKVKFTPEELEDILNQARQQGYDDGYTDGYKDGVKSQITKQQTKDIKI